MNKEKLIEELSKTVMVQFIEKHEVTPEIIADFILLREQAKDARIEELEAKLKRIIESDINRKTLEYQALEGKLKRVVEPLQKEFELLKSYFEDSMEVVLHKNDIDFKAIDQALKIASDAEEEISTL